MKVHGKGFTCSILRDFLFPFFLLSIFFKKMKKKSHEGWRSMGRVSHVQFSGTFYFPFFYFPYFLRKWKRNLTRDEGPWEGFHMFNSQGLSISLFLYFYLFLENEKKISRELLWFWIVINNDFFIYIFLNKNTMIWLYFFNEKKPKCRSRHMRFLKFICRIFFMILSFYDCQLIWTKDFINIKNRIMFSELLK